MERWGHAIYLNDGSFVPTADPNPEHRNQYVSNGTAMHSGGIALNNTTSANCITGKPSFTTQDRRETDSTMARVYDSITRYSGISSPRERMNRVGGPFMIGSN